jgi:Lrp/AsnC family leucine-responsive transcriptional regulator
MIDEVDRQIVSLLQTDARLSNSALAERVGLTASSVYERVKKLEKKGVIRGYVAVVDAGALGKPIMAFIRLTVGSADYLESKNSVLEICQREADVLECHAVAGEDCYVLKVRAAGTADLEKLIERIRSNTQVSRTITSIVFSTIKETTQVVPVPVEGD